MNMRDGLKYWLENLIICGREGEDDPYERDAQGAIVEEDGEQVLKEGWEYDADDKPVKVDPSKEDEEEEDTPEKKIADLEETLAKERRLRRQAEREARKNKRTTKKTTQQKKPEDDETQEKLRQSETRISRLAQGLLDSKIDQAIVAAARKAGFIDETDALTDAVRRAVDYDQDEEDPSDIEIDVDSVEDAVKELAAKKKHLVGKGTPSTPSATRQRRRKSGDDDELSEAALAGNYPGLRS